MPKTIIDGEPGETWRNDTEKVQYQLICDWENTCGLCGQYDHQIGSSWPIPFHRNCKCKQEAIWPGKTARPFTDFRETIRNLDPSQQAHVVGRSNLILIEKGIVDWKDVVTGRRIRDLREVVALKKINVDTMLKVGIGKKEANAAYKSVNTAKHKEARTKKQELIDKIQAMGMRKEELKRELGERLGGKFKLRAIGPAVGPAGPPAPVLPLVEMGPLGHGIPEAIPPKPPAAKPVAKPPENAPANIPVKAPVKAPAKPMEAEHPKPQGNQVSESLKLPQGKLAKSLKPALNAIDGIHGTGETTLPPIPVTRTETPGLLGAYVHDEHGVPTRIEVNPSGSTPRLSLLHEVGHWLDAEGVGGAKIGQRDYANDPVFSEWYTAVRGTKAVAELEGTKERWVASTKGEAGPNQGEKILPKFVDYMLAPHELWARSYAQHVATRSGSGALLRELEEERKDEGPVRYPSQWDDDDFAPVATAIDAMFMKLGWVK